MARSRIFQPSELTLNQEVILDPKASHHLANVLRVKPKDQLILFNGQGGEYLAEISQVKKKQVTAKMIQFFEVDRESPISIHLAQGISKGDRMDYAIQKSVELGVTEITPVFSEHCDVKRKTQSNEKKLMHWQNIMLSACEQSGRTQVTTIHAPQLFSDWLLNRPEDQKLILHPGDTKSTSVEKGNQSFALAIGPEGGFSQAEVESAQENNFQCLTLGPRILRTETAPAAAITVLQYTCGDFKKGNE